MVSKELLSEVLNDYKLIDNIEDDFWISGVNLGYKQKEVASFINIYELAHKCKEWALEKGHILLSWEANPVSGVECYCKSNNINRYPFKADTEPGAIFKACQYILDNKGKQ